MRDFTDYYPKACAIYTSHPKRVITDGWMIKTMRMSLFKYYSEHTISPGVYLRGDDQMDVFDDIINTLINNRCVRILVDVKPTILNKNNESSFGDELIETFGFSRESCRIIRSWAQALDDFSFESRNLLCWFF
jgi:vacuolar-type H+-ATPase subunit C/Vma6